MKILKLKFKNLNSLKGINTIDFTISPLSETGIFAIIGVTGSGKSTILDAITLALYNQVPRLDQVSKKTIADTGALITKNTNDCFSEVEYEIKGKQYRSKWEIGRARTGNLRDYHMEIVDLSTHKPLDLKKSEVPAKNTEIIGLNYEQFIKSILLSQGEFARFLKAKATERGELLEKITGTEIYRTIGRKAYEKNKEETQKLEHLTFKFNEIKILTPDEEKELSVKIKTAQNETLKNKETIKKLQELLQIKTSIEKLQKTKKELEQQQNKLTVEIQNFEPQKLNLQKHEQLLDLKEELIELKNLKKNVAETLYKLNKNENERINLQNNLDEKQKELDLQKSDYKDIKQEKETIFPKIKKAREITFQSTSEQKNLNEQNQTHKKLQNIRNNTIYEIKTLNEKVEQTQKNLEKTIEWLNANEILINLANDLPLLNDRSTTFLRQETQIINTLKKSESAIKETLLKTNSYNQKQKIIAKKYEELTNKINEIEKNNEINTHNLKDLRDKKEKLGNQYKELKDLSKKTPDYNQKTETIKKLTQTNENKTIKLKATNELIKKQTNEAAILKKYIDELTIKEERQKLEKNYEKDRLTLKPEDACPLCGSTEHPYIQEYKNTLAETEKKLKTKNTELENLQKNIQTNEKLIISTESEIKNNNIQIELLNAEIEKINIEFDEINKKYNSNFRPQNTENITKKIDEIIVEGKNTANLIEQIEQKNTLEQEKQEAGFMLEKINEITGNETIIFNTFNKYSQYTAKLETIKGKLNILLLEKEKYEKAMNAKQTNENFIQSSSQVLNEKNQQLKQQNLEIENSQKNITQTTQQIKELQKQKIDLIGNETPDAIENKINRQEETLDKKIQQTDKLITQLTENLKNKQTILLELTKNKQNLEQKYQSQNNQILPKLNKIGYKTAEETYNKFLSTEEVNQIKNKQKNLHERNASLQELLNEKITEIEKLTLDDKSELSIAELKNQLSQTEKQLSENNQQIGMITNKLDENAKRLETSKKLQTEIARQEKELERWQMLNNLIGDATGKKFSNYAQELTLKQLIGLANQHLKNFTERYLIQKGDSQDADLLIIDTFQANNQRSVKTLSGGETFLVSMSLALGLSDLAGQNTQIDSLFIDEGFGSLDNQTLDIALNALEKLQNESNRTIGIISHVESLKERIKTQIYLQKNSTGFSSIEIK